jgi:hypothetical protein
MSVLSDPAARAAAARKIAEDTGGRLEPKDPLSVWEREHFFAFDSVQMRLPLRNRTEVRTHLGMILETLTTLHTELKDKPRSERADLLLAHSTVRALNRKLNAYRKLTK